MEQKCCQVASLIMGNNVPHNVCVRLTSYYLFLSSIKVQDLYNEEVTCIPPTGIKLPVC